MNWLVLIPAIFVVIYLFVRGAFYFADRADDLADFEHDIAKGDQRLADVLRGSASFHETTDSGERKPHLGY